MKYKVPTLFVGLLISSFLSAVTVSTDPVGFITLTIKGTDTSDGLSAVSVPMLSASLSILESSMMLMGRRSPTTMLLGPPATLPHLILTETLVTTSKSPITPTTQK